MRTGSSALNFGIVGIGVFSLGFSKSVVYPLDVATLLCQVRADKAQEGPWKTLLKLLKNEGPASLYTGLSANCLSIALHNATVPAITQVMLSLAQTRNRFLNFGLMSVPLISGAILSHPLEVVRVRMITSPSKYSNLVDSITTIYKEEGPTAFFRGFFAEFLVDNLMFHCSMFSVFKVVELAWKRTYEMSPGERVVLSILASIIALVAQYPVITAIKIVQSQTGEPSSVLSQLKDLQSKAKWKRLYQGCTAYVAKPFPTAMLRSLLQSKITAFLK